MKLFRRQVFLIITITFLSIIIFINGNARSSSQAATMMNAITDSGEIDKPAKATPKLYESLKLAKLNLSRKAFDMALAGYNILADAGKLTNNKILSIIDFSQPSSKKRLYIIDLENGILLFNTYVAHGRNSGREMAREFSNDAESNKSSLGFFITGDTYIGQHGYSLRLEGEEKGINDHAGSRAIVMHSAYYVSEEIIHTQGFAGRSFGCPALPEELNKPIIDSIKNGSCLFQYSPDAGYAAHSAVLNKKG